MTINLIGRNSEMPDFNSEKNRMSSVEFAQFALREGVAPPTIGSLKARLRHATHVMRRRNWSANRVKDCWYADPRIRPDADEIRDLEDITGLRYGKQELSEIDALISQAGALLNSQDPDFHGAFVAAIRAFAGSLHRTGTKGDDQ
jgi:hypothetical protein